MAATLSGSKGAGSRVPIPHRPSFGQPDPVEILGPVVGYLRPPRRSHDPGSWHRRRAPGLVRRRTGAPRSIVTPTIGANRRDVPQIKLGGIPDGETLHPTVTKADIEQAPPRRLVGFWRGPP
jgi:hypothetical protein